MNIEELKELLPDWAQDLSDSTIDKMLVIYAKDMSVLKNDIDPEDFADWVNIGEAAGDFVIDYFFDLSQKAVTDLCGQDPDMIEDLLEISRALGWTDKDGYEIQTLDDAVADRAVSDHAHKFTYADALRNMYNILDEKFMFDIIKAKYIYDFINFKKFNETELEVKDRAEKTLGNNKNKDIDDIAYTHESLEEAADITSFDDSQLALSDSEVEEINSPFEDPAKDAAEEVKAEVEAEGSVEEVPEDPVIENNAFAGEINNLISAKWGFIDAINSAIATFDSMYKGPEKENIKAILTSIADDTTISIGMLYKVSQLVDQKSAELIDSGSEKAEEIIK